MRFNNKGGYFLPFSQNGFTLFEVLIVLAIIALISAFALPNIYNSFRGFTEKLEQEEIEKQLRQIPYKVYLKGQDFSLSEDTLSDALKINEKFTLSIEEPIVYRYDGLCKGGQVKVQTDLKSKTYQLDAPYCFPQLIDENDK